MRRRRNLPVVPIVITCAAVLFILLVSSFFSGGNQAKRVVDDFYAYEQDGNFNDSWELFHPDMKKKFKQSDYIQDRSDVFIGHFGADTFTYTIEEEGTIDNWRMTEESSAFPEAYQFVVTQQYNGKYGSFRFQQDVYVVEHKGDWVIAWDYK